MRRCISTRSAVGNEAGRAVALTSRVLYWSVQRSDGLHRSLDDRPDRHPRVVPRPRRRRGQARRASPAPAAASAACSPTRSRTPAPRSRSSPAPRRTSRRSPRRCPARPSSSAATSPTRTSTRPSPTPPSPSGAALDVWICNAGISPVVGRPARAPTPRCGGRCSRSTSPARSSAPAPPPGSWSDGGRLIFTGSVLGERPRKGLAAYSASKAGLVGMAKALALDLAPAGITVNVVAPGWFDSPLAEGWMSNPELVGGDHRPHRPAALGRHRPTWPAPTSSSPPTPRRSSPAPCSPSTAGTCSYDRHRRRGGSSSSPAPAVRSARPSPPGWPASPTPTSCSATSARPSLDATVAGLPGDRRRGRDGPRRRRATPTRSQAVVDLAVERFGRLDVLISNAGVLSPNGRIHNLTTEDWERAFRINVLGAVNGIKAAVGVMRPQRSGSIVLTASVSGLTAWSHAAPVLRHQGGGDPARQGGGGRVRPRRHPGELRVPGHVPLGDPRRAAARGARRHRRPATRSGSARPTTSSAPTRTWRATTPAGRPARRSSSTAATRRP